jgi:hypothetical protein
MARHRKPGRPKGSTAKKKLTQSNVLESVDPVVLHQVSAIILFLFAFIILVGAVGFGGNLGNYLAKELLFIIGWSTYLLPFLLAGTGYSLFNPEDYEITTATVVGLSLFVLSFSGIFHIFVNPTTAVSFARNGQGGGILGLIIQKLMLQVLNAPVSFVV